MTTSAYINRISGIAEHQIEAVVKLLDKDATVPFIARYRKEATGNLDEVEIAKIRDAYKSYKDMQERKKVILASIEEQGKLHGALREKI